MKHSLKQISKTRYQATGEISCAPACRNDRGMTLIEISILVGLMSLIAITISQMSRFGFEGLRHVRIANDIDAVENLVKLTLTRPQTPSEVTARVRVCLASIPMLRGLRYTGARVDLPANRDNPQDIIHNNDDRRSILKSLNSRNGPDQDYDIKARFEAATGGATTILYPDDANGGNLGNFNLWMTKLTIYGEKMGTANHGGTVLQGQLPIGMITRADSTMYDCIVNPMEYENICRLLGGKYSSNPAARPRCLLTKVPVADDWDKIPDSLGFKDGDLYSQNMVMVGDQTQLTGARTRWDAQRGLLIGTGGGYALGFGQNGSGMVGFILDYLNTTFFSIFTETNVFRDISPDGVAVVRTYGNRPFVFSNVYPGGGATSTSKDHLVMDPARRLLVADGSIIASDPRNINTLLTGAESSLLMDGVGLMSAYNNGIKVALGSLGGTTTTDMGLWIRSSTLPPGAYTRTLAAIYYGLDYTSPTPGSQRGGLVFKHYNFGDLIFQNRQEPGGTCNNCTPLIIKGNLPYRGNVGFGLNFTTDPTARLHVRGTSGDTLRVEGTTTLNHNVNVTGNVNIDGENNDTLVDGNIRSRTTVSAASDRRLKTDIQPISGALNRLLQIKGVSYRWRDPSKPQSPQIGVIAQDVEKVFPEFVLTDQRGFKAVTYQYLVAPMIEAMKEQQHHIKDLERSQQLMDSRLSRMLRKICKDNPSDRLCKN